MTVGTALIDHCVQPVLFPGVMVSANIPGATVVVGKATWQQCSAQLLPGPSDTTVGCNLGCPEQQGIQVAVDIDFNGSGDVYEYDNGTACAEYKATWQ